MKKIIIILIISIFTLIGLAEFASYLYVSADDREFIAEHNKEAAEEGGDILTQRYAPVKLMKMQLIDEKLKKEEKSLDADDEDYEDDEDEEETADSDEEEDLYPVYRKGYTGKPSKGSILFYGCLYTYGASDNAEQTIPYITGKLSGMTTINRGMNGGSPVTMLHDLNNNEIYNILKTQTPKAQTPKYIVYTFINDQYKRIINPYRTLTASKKDSFYDVSPIYIKKDGVYAEQKPSPFKLFLYSLYTTKAYYKFISRDIKNARGQFIDLLIEAKKITDEKFPGSKFVILMYKDGSGHNLSRKIQKKLTNEGFIILDSEKIAGHELTSEEWRLPDGEHPNERAFTDTAKGLIKELGL